MPTTNEFDIMDTVYKRCRAGRKPQYKCIFGGLGGGVGWVGGGVGGANNVQLHLHTYLMLC